MPKYVTTKTTSWDRGVTFDYLADFQSVADWDPSVPRARLASGEPAGEGAHYEVAFEQLGRTSNLDYEVLEAERPERVVLRAETATFVSLDTMTFVDTGGGTEVTYNAEIILKGPLKLIGPAFGLIFNRIGDKAAAGLEKRLAAPAPARAADPAKAG